MLLMDHSTLTPKFTVQELLNMTAQNTLCQQNAFLVTVLNSLQHAMLLVKLLLLQQLSQWLLKNVKMKLQLFVTTKVTSVGLRQNQLKLIMLHVGVTKKVLQLLNTMLKQWIMLRKMDLTKSILYGFVVTKALNLMN